MAATSTSLCQLDEYRLLGASGLRVSALCLGAMTFGTEWNIGSNFEESKRQFDYYVEKGGNFVDTANLYNEGTSERFVGELVAPLRSKMVVTTKYSSNPGGRGRPDAKNVQYGGSHRKALVQNVDESLKRMNLDYIDLLYVHVWDQRTPLEETMRALDDVSQDQTPLLSFADGGKTLQLWCLIVPWSDGKSSFLSSPYIALQSRYNLLERSLEYDLGPMAQALDIGIIPWGSTAEGFLTGKHKRDQPGENRRGPLVERHFKDERNWKILDEVVAIAEEVQRTPAQVALNWLAQKPGVTSPLVGARTLDQLKENIAALEFKLSPDQMKRLDQISERPLSEQPFPKNFNAIDWTAGDFKVEKRYAI